MRGINAAHVKTGISLGITLGLRLGEDVGKISPAAFHLGQDEIAGSVQNAINALNPIGACAFAQALHHRDPARHGRFEFERRGMRLSQPGQRQTVMRNHRLIGCDKAFASAKSALSEFERRTLRPADQFRDQINILARGHSGHVIGPQLARNFKPAILGFVARIDRSDGDRTPGPRLDLGAVFLKQAHHANADSAKSGDSNAQGIGGLGFREIRHCAPPALVRLCQAARSQRIPSAHQEWPAACRSPDRHAPAPA